MAEINLCNCGHEAVYEKLYSNRDGGFVRCPKCGQEGRSYTSKQNAIKAWNKANQGFSGVRHMKKSEMVAYIMNHPGVKITHRLFDEDEYIYMAEDGQVYDERGYLFEDWGSERWSRDGIRSRTGEFWETGWSTKEETVSTKVPEGVGEPVGNKNARVSKSAYMALRDMFVDFVCSGVHNPAPYCENVCSECVNAYGCCRRDSDACRGFSPKVERKGNV